MAKTIQDILTESRFLLQDSVEPYRNGDASLLRIVNSAMYELKRVRPDVWLGSYNTALPTFSDTPADLEKEIPFDQLVFQPFIFYIVGFVELQDDEFAVDGRAAAMLRMFTGSLTASLGRSAR